jgi:hypothetical protein
MKTLPAGCDQQGRYETRTHRVTCTDDDPPREPMTIGDKLALAVVLFVGGLAFWGAVAVAWTRWLP